jgi:lipopolysaccharide export system permease protein
MNILDRYIARVVISGTLMVLLVLGALLAFVDFVGEIGEVGKGHYGLFDALLYVILSLPKRMYELFPTAVLLGSLLSLGGLASNSELTVMRASGISITRFVVSVLQAGLLLAVFVALVGELVVPQSERQAQTIRATALKETITFGGQHGLWARDGLRYIRVGRVYPGFQLGDLSIYELNESRQLVRVTHAASARYKDDTWQLRNIRRSSIEGDQVQKQVLTSETWPSLFNPDLFNVVGIKPANMSAVDLYRYSDYLQDNELDSSHYRLAFWIKVLTPVSSMVMLLIALPFIFGSQRSGQSGGRIMIGLLLGIGFFLLNRTMNHIGQVYGLDPLFSAALPVVVVAVAGALALRRVH